MQISLSDFPLQSVSGGLTFRQRTKTMRNLFPLLSAVAMAAAFATGCAGPERKFGRGINNTFEIVRHGELRRSLEQTAMVYTPEEGYTRGAVTGLNRTLARTGVGK